jgi:hypothetical protein
MPLHLYEILNNALLHVHRAYPVGRGTGLLNGDLRQGMWHALNPIPFDLGFPDSGSNAAASL